MKNNFKEVVAQYKVFDKLSVEELQEIKLSPITLVNDLQAIHGSVKVENVDMGELEILTFKIDGKEFDTTILSEDNGFRTTALNYAIVVNNLFKHLGMVEVLRG